MGTGRGVFHFHRKDGEERLPHVVPRPTVPPVSDQPSEYVGEDEGLVFRSRRGPTIWARNVPPVPMPVRLTVSVDVAKAKARRAFWLGWLAGGNFIAWSYIFGNALIWWLA